MPASITTAIIGNVHFDFRLTLNLEPGCACSLVTIVSDIFAFGDACLCSLILVYSIANHERYVEQASAYELGGSLELVPSFRGCRYTVSRELDYRHTTKIFPGLLNKVDASTADISLRKA